MSTTAQPAAAKVRSGTRPRLLYIDNVRTVLITLVVLCHLAITYGAEGAWYYSDAGEESTVAFIIIMPLLASGAAENDIPFQGGWHWQALFSALWESFLCLSMCIGLTYAFRRYGDRQGRLAGCLSRNAQAAYLIHEPLITAMALAMGSVALYPLLKFGLTALVAIPLCFGLGSLIRKLPYTDRML